MNEVWSCLATHLFVRCSKSPQKDPFLSPWSSVSRGISDDWIQSIHTFNYRRWVVVQMQGNHELPSTPLDILPLAGKITGVSTLTYPTSIRLSKSKSTMISAMSSLFGISRWNTNHTKKEQTLHTCYWYYCITPVNILWVQIFRHFEIRIIREA